MDKQAELQFIETDSTIVSSTIFKLNIPGEYSEKYHYSRYSNPTRDSLEAALAKLDNAKFAVTYSSKVAGTCLAVMSTLKAYDHVIFSDSIIYEKIKNLNPTVDAELIDFDDLKNLEKSIKETTKIVWIESLSIPLMSRLDIKFIADIVHQKSKALLVVDNTFLTPHFQRPLELGADIVVYSLDEFIAGHNDIAMGAITTNDPTIHDKLKYYQYSSGAVPSPFDCFMVKRSLKTLSLRMERHSKNSFEVAQFLIKHSKIENVEHSKGSGVLSIKLKGDSIKFLTSLKTIVISECLGGCESVAMIHSKLSEKDQTFNKTIYFSIGIEDSKEIIADLDQALSNV